VSLRPSISVLFGSTLFLLYQRQLQRLLLTASGLSRTFLAAS